MDVVQFQALYQERLDKKMINVVNYAGRCANPSFPYDCLRIDLILLEAL
ncbi:MAG: hypothetical protein M1151_02535 [Candidatus Thermoplasmatota archaeon]|nr:hypothetical protein [Candidatus Thermoplasmatota archaeon]